MSSSATRSHRETVDVIRASHSACPRAARRRDVVRRVPRRSRARVLRRAAARAPRVRVFPPRVCPRRLLRGRPRRRSRSAPSASSPAPSAAPVVFGANGKTGKRCVAYAAKTGRPVVACTRAGAFSAADAGVSSADASLVTSRPGDVSKASPADSPRSSRARARASSPLPPPPADPQDVDKAGLVAVARACVAARVPRLVVVSSGSVTKPLSPVLVFLNFRRHHARQIEGERSPRAR